MTDDPPVQCWHTGPGSPCDWNICRQPKTGAHEQTGAALARYIADQRLSEIQGAMRILGLPPLRFGLAEAHTGDPYTRASQAEELLHIAHGTSNTSEAERARAVRRADDVLRIVAAWRDDIRHGHVVGADELVARLEMAGYALPE